MTIQEELIEARKKYRILHRRYRRKRRGMRQRRPWGTVTHKEEMQLLRLGRRASQAKQEYEAAMEQLGKEETRNVEGGRRTAGKHDSIIN